MSERPTTQVSLPRPQGAVLWVMVAILSVWLGFAVAINWVGVGEGAYRALWLDRDALFRGELWRLFTAPLLHDVSGRTGVSHVVTNLLLLYFFGPPMQKASGELLQLGLDLVLPATVAPPVHQKVLLGALGMGIATTVAWGFSHPRQQVLMMMVLPITGLTLVWFTVGFYILSLLAVGSPPEGLLAPFGAMLCGYLLGGGEPSPLRKAFLRWKLKRLESGGAPSAASSIKAQKPPHLRVIRGMKEDDEPGPRPNPDKRWLN
jgi:membrane associated rhomboid family serine protease